MNSKLIKQSVEFIKTLQYNKKMLNNILKNSGRELLIKLLDYENLLIEKETNKLLSSIRDGVEIMCDFYNLKFNKCNIEDKLICKICDRVKITEVRNV